MLALILAPPEDPRERADSEGVSRRARSRGSRRGSNIHCCSRRRGRGASGAATGTPPRRSPPPPRNGRGFARRASSATACRPSSTSLRKAYGWSDRLASHFAQNYRSGHVFNFLFAALAVLVALTGLLVPDAKIALAVAEFGLILAIMLNTRIGVQAAMAPALARLSPAGRAAAADAQPEIARDRRARPAGERGRARSRGAGSTGMPRGVWRAMGCPSGQHRPRPRASADPGDRGAGDRAADRL